MKTKFIILFNTNGKQCYFKYKIVAMANNIKLNNTNGFNEKVVGLITIPYYQYMDEKEYIKNRLKH